MKRLLTVAACVVWAGAVVAQTVPLANPSFEEAVGNALPGWTLNIGEVERSSDAVSGDFSLLLAGDPDSTVSLTSDALDLEPLATYAMRYKVKVTEYAAGVPIAG